MPSKVPELSIWKQILRILSAIVLLNLLKKHGEYLPWQEFCSVWVLTSVQSIALLCFHSLVLLSCCHKVVWKNSWKQCCRLWFHSICIYSFMCGPKWVSLDRIEKCVLSCNSNKISLFFNVFHFLNESARISVKM